MLLGWRSSFATVLKSVRTRSSERLPSGEAGVVLVLVLVLVLVTVTGTLIFVLVLVLVLVAAVPRKFALHPARISRTTTNLLGRITTNRDYPR